MASLVARDADLSGVGQDILDYVEAVAEFFGDTIVVTSGYRDSERQARAMFDNWTRRLRRGQIYRSSALSPADRETLDQYYRIARETPSATSAEKAAARQSFLDLASSTQSLHGSGRAIDIDQSSLSPGARQALLLYFRQLEENGVLHFESMDQVPAITDEIREQWKEFLPEGEKSKDAGEGSSNTESTPTNNDSAPANAESSGGILASIGGFFSTAAERIGGFFGLGNSNGGSTALVSGPFGFGRIGFDPGSDLEKLLSQGLDKFTDKLADRLAKNDHILNQSLGRTLTQNSGLFGDLLKKAKLGDLTGGLEDVFSSKNLGNIFGDFIGNAAAAGVGRLLGAGKVRTTVTSQESERSREASRAWNPSRSQQAAMLAQMVQQGSRNL